MAEWIVVIGTLGFIAVFFLIMGWLNFQYRRDTKRIDAEALERRLGQSPMMVKEWAAGWRCPVCGDWGDTKRDLGPSVCGTCGTPAQAFEQVKYQPVFRLNSQGYYRLDKDATAARIRPIGGAASGRCPYCGRDPCGCGYIQILVDGVAS